MGEGACQRLELHAGIDLWMPVSPWSELSSADLRGASRGRVAVLEYSSIFFLSSKRALTSALNLSQYFEQPTHSYLKLVLWTPATSVGYLQVDTT